MTGAGDPESGAREEELQLQEQLEKQEKKKKQQFKDDIGVLVAMVLLALSDQRHYNIHLPHYSFISECTYAYFLKLSCFFGVFQRFCFNR